MVRFDDISVGDALPELRKVPDRIQLVKYAAGSGDFNPLHYDPDFAQAREIGDNIVHGRLKYAALGELVSNWLAHGGRIRRIACQYRGMDLRAAPFTCKGTVTGKRAEVGERVVDLDIWTETESGEKTTPGTAVVTLSE